MIDLLALADRLENLFMIDADDHEIQDLRDAALVLRRVQTVIEWCDEPVDYSKPDYSVEVAKAHVRSLLQPPSGEQ